MIVTNHKKLLELSVLVDRFLILLLFLNFGYSIVSNLKKFDIQEIGGSVVQPQDQINNQVQGKGDLEEILIIVPTLLCIL